MNKHITKPDAALKRRFFTRMARTSAAFTCATLIMLALIMPPLIMPAKALDFVPGTEDIPLMNGLYIDSETQDLQMNFSSPKGRVVESFANPEAGIGWQQISHYYISTLPALGWQPKKVPPDMLEGQQDKALLFSRQDETLFIVWLADQQKARFLLSPL